MPPIAQYVFNGIVTGGILALPAVAFSLLWKLLRFPNFAVSTYLTTGAFAAFAINAKFVEGAGADVAEGVWAIDPAPSFDSPAYKQFLAAVPAADKNPYAPQAWDHMTLVGLALAAGRGEASGTIIKDTLRTVSNPPGTVVTSYEEGARLLREGKKINYEGASGSCDFDAQGDILSRPFGVYQVRQGKVEQASIINP